MSKIAFLYKIVNYPSELYRRLRFKLQKAMLKECGNQVRFGRNVEINWSNCSIGNDVYIGDNAIFLCADAPLHIGDHVMFGPNCSIITGDHRIDIIGKYMSKVTITEKLPENDMPVVIVGDNWIGANALILKGVTVGRGAVIGAGAVVTHNVPPYSIVGGVPAKVISRRFSPTEIYEHEKILAGYKG